MMPGMPNVVFVAPLFRANTIRYLQAFAELPGVRLAAISSDSPAGLDPALRERLIAHRRVPDAMDADALTAAARALAVDLGGLEVLTGALEELQIPVAVARDRLGLPGISEAVARNFRE